MQYRVEHLKADGSLVQLSGDISYLAFCKHMMFAGLGPDHFRKIAFRFVSIYFDWLQYWNNNGNCFSVPTPFNNDPTEINYISNRIGRAFADYFSKKLYGARYTHAYEDAMVRRGHPLKGKRPDFYCDTLTEQFAVEAKGKTTKFISPVQMRKVKSQANEGPLNVNFTVASVAYDLYSAPKIKFHDPVNGEFPYDAALNMQLRSLYYSYILELIDTFGSDRGGSDFSDYVSYDIFPFAAADARLLVHRAIVSKEWYSNEWLLEISSKDASDEKADSKWYVDLDGIGLTIR